MSHPTAARRTPYRSLALAVPLCGVVLATVTACGGVVPGSTPADSTAATPTAAPVLPTDLAGENGQVALKELQQAGFKDPIFQSTDGKSVLLYSDWTVVSAKDEHGTAVVQVTK
jgi:hypothetical protein